MPSRRIVLSASASERLRAARQWLEELETHEPVLVLANEQAAVDHLVRDIARKRGSLFGTRRLTLDALAYRLALPVLASENRASHSRLGQEAVTARLVHDARQDGRLGPLAAVANGPGLVRALASTLQECRLFDLGAETLKRLDGLGETLAYLLERYETLSKNEGLADHADVLRLAAREAERSESTLLGIPTLVLDVAFLSPLESRLLKVIADQAPRFLATTPHGDEVTLRHLESAAGVQAEKLVAGATLPAAIRDLQNHLFQDTTPESPQDTEDVVVLSAPGEAQESVEVARVVQIAAAAGTAFDRIAVLLRSPEVYTPLLEDAFHRAGIPAHFEKGTLRPDPAGRAFLALIDCTAEGVSATRFAEYLSLSQVPELDASRRRIEPEPEQDDPAEPALWVPPRHAMAPPAPEEEPVQAVQLELFAEPKPVAEPDRSPAVEGTLRTPWRWEKLIVDAAVIGGYDRWERRLAGLSHELDLRIAELDDPEGSEAESLQKQRDELDHLKRFALPLIDRLARLPEEACWKDWLEALEALAREALVRPEGVLAILKELRPMDSVGPVGILEVREVLVERLTLLSQEPARYRYGNVWVAPIDAVRGAAFDLVIVPGVAERMFPRKIVEDPLLLDDDRRKLSAGLPLQRDRVARERLALRLAVGAAARKVVLSYPSVDLTMGRSKVPSFYLLEVSRASLGQLPDFETLERNAARRSGARIGWPAPRSREDAIDSTEYDLAFLSDALRSGATEEEARGTGRYLVTTNPYLASSLRRRYQSGRQGRFTWANGFLDPSDAALELLRAKHRLRERTYSVTALEKYAACPYRFFLNALLRLRPRETIEELTHLDALTNGRILHDAQFHVLGRLESEGLVPVTPENLDACLRVFEVVFDEVAGRFHEELAPAIERIWEDEVERLRTDLRGWLRREAATDDGFVPRRREYTFGMRPRGPADPDSTLEVAVLADGLRLRGAIDLIEKRSDGRARVTDHKSGKAWMPKSAVLNGGQNLQPILYTLAYEALTGEDVDSARLYYCTERGGYEERHVFPDSESLDVAAEFQRRLDDVIAEGFFPAAPAEKFGCNFCDYQPVCGPHAEILAKRKQNDPRLSPLNWLRNLT